MMDTSPTPLPPRSMPRFSAECPSRPILDQIADKWSMMVLAVLEQPTRFNEIKRQLEGVTQRVLTQTLRKLERNGLIQRRVLQTSPIGVEYSLTHLGESFREPFTRLYDWTVEHSDQVLVAQLEYDARSSGLQTVARPVSRAGVAGRMDRGAPPPASKLQQGSERVEPSP